VHACSSGHEIPREEPVVTRARILAEEDVVVESIRVVAEVVLALMVSDAPYTIQME